MIRPASHDEALAVFNSDGVTQRVGFEVTSINRGDPFIINERLLVLFTDINPKVIEVHLAQSRKNWKHLHDDIDEGLKLLVNQGYQEVITSVTAKLKTTINLIKKHGFIEVAEYGDKVFLRCHL
jgi:hypothetical protein